MPNVDFAIVGAGAIGSIIGAHLARSSHCVVMLVRARRARQIAQDGLRIKGLAEFSQSVPTLTDPSQLTGAGVLIMATKTYVTEAVLASLRRADIGVAFSIQNGMMKDDLLADAFGKQRVLGSLANLSGEMLGSGEVLFTRNANLFVGELDGSDSARARQIAETIDAAGVRASADPDILSLEWSKFAAYAALMALSVTTRALTWKYLIDAGTARVLVRLVREVGMLAAACEVRLSDRAMLPVATICRESEQDAMALLEKFGLDMKSSAPEHRVSTLQDLEAGRPLEVEETLGHAVRKAAQLKLSLPLLGSFYDLVAGIDRIRRQQGAIR
ncbi:MAG: 2-dehydropantoate 2-reductase [Steroidobacteraceae bacterium]